MPSKLGLLACLFLSLSLALQGQTTIHVPADRPTIQAGINAANAGDTVLVAPGTYTENIDFKGKAITVTSSGGAAVTLIDGSKEGNAAVSFATGEVRQSVLNGFTIQGGGSEVNGVASTNGGIYVYGSQPTITSNVITHNHCHGIYANAAAPLIENNEIDNTLDGTHNCGFAGGAAIWLFDSPDVSLGPGLDSADGPVIIGNLLQNNTQSGMEDAGGNGGAAIADWTDRAVIESNTVRNNVTAGEGAIFAYNGTTITVVGNLIYGNSAYLNSGGLDIQVPGNGQTAGPFFGIIANNTIYGNQVTIKSSDPANAGSQVWLEGNLSQYVLVNNVIVGAMPGVGTVTCATVFSSLSYTPVVFDHNDIYSAAADSPAYAGACQDQTGMYGNLSVDPQLLNPAANDFHVRLGSPIIDSGNNSAPIILGADIAGSARLQDATGLGHPVIDMGAYEGAGLADTAVTTLTLTPSTFFPGGSLYVPVPSGPFTLTAKLAAQNGAVPTGPVTFYEDLKPIATQTADATGSTTLQPSVLPGLHAFLATYPGQGAYPAAVSVKFYVLFPMATPSLLLSASPNPSILGSPVTFTLKASSSDGVVPSPVTLSDTSSNTTLATLIPDSTGTATFTTSTLALGTHLVTASFGGSGTDDPASASVTQVVINGLATTTTLTSSLNPSTYGQPVTFTTHVTPSTASTGTPTGTVTFLDGSNTLATVPLDGSGTASLTTAVLIANAPGTSHLITASYTPAGGFASSSASLNQVVNGLSTVVSIVPSSASATAGQPVILNTTVVPANPPGPAAITGTVAYFDGAIPLGTATLATNGVVGFSISSLPPGQNTITCTYSGNAVYAPSSCSPVTVTVTGVPTTTNLTASPNPAYQGQAVTLTAVISANGSPATSGTLTFYDGATALGTGPLNTSGQATLSTSSLAPGTHTLTASYPPSGTLIGSTSPSVQELILPSGFALSLTPTTLTVQAGQKGTARIALTSLGNFAGSLTLSFGALPSYASASLSPTTVTLAAGGTGAANLLLTTSTISANSVPPRPGTRPWPLVLSALVLLPLGLVRSKQLRHLLCLAFAAFLLGSLSGCTTIRTPFDLVAAGSYQVPVTAADTTGHQQTATLTVVITP